MPNIWIRETFVNTTREAQFGETEPFESFTDDLGKLYKSLRSEYGRCSGRVYIDRKDAPPMPVGWVFIKRMKYEDARDNSPKSYYLREVWVHCYSGPIQKTVQYPASIDISKGVAA